LKGFLTIKIGVQTNKILQEIDQSGLKNDLIGNTGSYVKKGGILRLKILQTC
jgi:hypothetical protein